MLRLEFQNNYLFHLLFLIRIFNCIVIIILFVIFLFIYFYIIFY